MRKTISGFAGCLLSGAVLMSVNCHADELITYSVTITNLTLAQPITPPMVATHQAGMSFFTPGEAPPTELAPLAEAGNGQPMADKLLTMPQVSTAQVASNVIVPGGSITLTISAKPGDHLSLGGMLGNTNDAFAALTDVALPKPNRPLVYMAPAYDAGTETNDESCASIPGPACGGEALSPADSGEGIVTIHNGIHGIGDLNVALYDWRNPVAKVVVTRLP